MRDWLFNYFVEKSPFNRVVETKPLGTLDKWRSSTTICSMDWTAKKNLPQECICPYCRFELAEAAILLLVYLN